MPAKWVTTLLALQANDLRVRDLEQRLELIPKEMLNLKAKRDKAVADTQQAAEAARKFERAAKAAESEIARLNDESAKLRQQSAMVKKNNEYQAMLNTVALNQKKISELESKVIELLDRFEEGKKAYRRIRTENEAIARDARAEFEELSSFVDDLKNEIERLKKERPSLCSTIETSLEQRYNALLKGKNAGAPLVAVDGGICGHCHLRVTPQAMNGIAKGAVTVCDNCQHLIYQENNGE